MTTNNFEENFGDMQFADNPDPRCPVVLILDSSSSMFQVREGQTQSPMESLNTGLDFLMTELYSDPLSRRRISVSFTVYGSDVRQPTDFAEVDDIVLPDLTQQMGTTSTGKAICAALDHLKEYKAKLDKNGIQKYRPFIILMSDGLSTDDLTEARERIKAGDTKEAKEFSFFAVGIDGADMEQLNSLGNRQALPLKNDSFREFFQWLSASTASVSQSQPDDEKISIPAPTGWTEL